MTYAALLEAYGWERFATDAAARGATSLIVSDVPAGQRPELRRIHLVAPTSTDERIRLAASTTDGWLYLVTLTGTTGARAELSSALEGLVARTRSLADGVPLYAGFGISTPEQAAARGGARRRRRRRLPRRAGRRGRPRRRSPRTSPRSGRRSTAAQWLTRTRLPQREQRAGAASGRTACSPGRGARRPGRGTAFTARGRRGRASSRCSRPRAAR